MPLLAITKTHYRHHSCCHHCCLHHRNPHHWSFDPDDDDVLVKIKERTIIMLFSASASQLSLNGWTPSDKREDTIVNTLSADQHELTVLTAVRYLSVRKLRSIRKATGGNDRFQLTGKAVEHALIRQDLSIERSVWTTALANETRPAMARKDPMVLIFV